MDKRGTTLTYRKDTRQNAQIPRLRGRNAQIPKDTRQEIAQIPEPATKQSISLQLTQTTPYVQSNMSDRREKQEKANRIILQGSDNYTIWKSYTFGKLQQKNCDWAITKRPEPTKMLVKEDVKAIGFNMETFTTQVLYTALTTKIKEHRAALKKAERIIKNSVAHKHQAQLEGKTAKEMWKGLKAKFQHISRMTISRLLLDTTRIQLLECSDMHEYGSKYQEAYNTICNMIPADCKLSAKRAAMILQAGLFTKMGDKYSSLVSSMESEWVSGKTNLTSSILRLTRFAKIRKENAKTGGTAQASALLTAKPALKLGRNRVPPRTCTFPDCIKKGLTTHYPDRCFFKFPELQNKPWAKYTLQ